MEKNNDDLRIRRTRKLLSTSLFDLMAEKDFSKISVNEICDKAMVHRATFYNHFKDKEDLLNYTLDEIQEALFEKSVNSSDAYYGKQTYMNLISCVIDFIIENNDNLAKIRKNCSEKMIFSFIETMKRSVKYLIHKNKANDYYDIPEDNIINFLTGGFAVIGLNLLEDKTHYSKEELMRFCDILLNEKLFDGN